MAEESKGISRLQDLINGIGIAVMGGYKGFTEYRKVQKMSQVKVIFLTSDYGIYGLNGEVDGIVSNEEDVCMINGFDRLFFGDIKRGIITYRDSKGMDYVVISDGDFQVSDVNKLKEIFRLKSEKLKLNDISEVSQIPEGYEELKKKLDDLHIKTLGITMDMNALDDHLKSKDFTVWAKKVMNHGFFKSLTKFPTKMVVMLLFLGGFLGTTLLLMAQFVIASLYIFARLII